MLLKKLRPNRLIAALIIGFSASILSAGFIKNVAGLYITRLLLGVFESGLFPYDFLSICMAVSFLQWLTT